MEQSRRALFLDRDGVVNREIGYLWQPELTEFTPGIFELCRVAQQRQYKLIILTNQSGIARELYSESDFHLFMQSMVLEFTRQQIQLDGYYYCPHHPQHGVGRYLSDCGDRKPNPGMLLRAACDHQIDLRRSVLIGDRWSDIQAGAAASVGTIMLMRGTGPRLYSQPHLYTEISNLMDAVPMLTQPEGEQ